MSDLSDCEDRNRRLQQTLELHTRPDHVTMTEEFYKESLAGATQTGYVGALVLVQRLIKRHRRAGASADLDLLAEEIKEWAVK